MSDERTHLIKTNLGNEYLYWCGPVDLGNPDMVRTFVSATMPGSLWGIWWTRIREVATLVTPEDGVALVLMVDEVRAVVVELVGDVRKVVTEPWWKMMDKP